MKLQKKNTPMACGFLVDLSGHSHFKSITKMLSTPGYTYSHVM